MATKKKTTTEVKTLDEFWGDFSTEYKSFVEWFSDKETGNKFTMLQFISDKPEEYTNKWKRQQWKILCSNDYGEEVYLSGGKRLFQTIKRFCQSEESLPSELPELIIWRIGEGFDTRYKIEKR